MVNTQSQVAYWFIRKRPSPSGSCPVVLYRRCPSTLPSSSAHLSKQMSAGIQFIDRVCRSTTSARVTGWTPGVGEEMRNRCRRSCSYHLFFLISDKLACAGFVFYLYKSGLTQVRLRICFPRYSPATLSERNEHSSDKTLARNTPVHSVFRVSRWRTCRLSGVVL